MRGFAEQSAEGAKVARRGLGREGLSVCVPGETASLSQEGHGRCTGSAWALTIVFVDDLGATGAGAWPPRRASSTR